MLWPLAVLAYTTSVCILHPVLSDESIASFSPEPISVAPQLAHDPQADLENCTTESIKASSDGSLYPSPRLMLNLTGMNLVSLDDSNLYDHPLVQVVDASNNPIESIGILHSDTIKEINLRNGELRWVRPANFRDISNLERLLLVHNRHLTTIDLDVPSLSYLDASHCSVSDVSFDRLINLKVVNLSHNRITKISDSAFTSNSKLEILDLSHNDIEHIDDYTFIRAVQLVTLVLSWNKIDRTEWSMTLKSVLDLDISHNNIETIDMLMLRRVHTLNVSHNKLTHCPEELGRLLPCLQILNVSSNPIRKIKRIKSVTLTELRLRECKIGEIAMDGFNEVPSLTMLDVADNKLQSLDFVLSLSNKSAVILNDNPWECFCNVSIDVEVLCHPSNLTLEAFCSMREEPQPAGDSWFLEAANPVIWAPLVVALVIVVVACFGFKTYKKSRQTRDVDISYESVPIDLIRNLPEAEDDRNRFFTTLLHVAQDHIRSRDTAMEVTEQKRFERKMRPIL